MGRRVLPALLAVVAATADSAGVHGLAEYALLAAVPFAAVAALTSFGDYLDTRDDAVAALQSLLWGLAVALLVGSCAIRSQAIGVPPAASSALFGCLVVFALKAALALVPHVRRVALRPAKP
ncbi:MAG: hypothetical protein ACJ77I_11285 [Chloroflexota bacterium]